MFQWNWRRIVFALAVLAMGYGASFSLFDHHADFAEASAAAEPAPEVVLNRLGGGQVKLSAYKGKWVFLNFWATWCGPCVAEMPSMEGFYKKFKAKNMVVLAVSVDRAGPETVKDFVKKNGLTFDIFQDAGGDASGKFGVYALPHTFIINPKGEIVSQAPGAREWTDPEIVAYFNDLMSRKK